MFDRSLDENRDVTTLEEFNDLKLDLLKNDIEALINLQIEDQRKLDEMIAYIRKQLILNKVYLDLDAGINSLKEIIANHLLAQMLEQTNTDLSVELDRWFQKYPQLIQAEKTAKVTLSKGYQDNITESLLKTGAAASTWGDDRDVNLLLRDHISHPDTVKIESDMAYILPPVAIVSSEIEAQSQDAVDLFVNQIMPVLEKSVDQQNVTVEIPVTTQAHWRLFVAEINYGKITEAVLLDSAEGDNEDLTVVPAYRNAQQAVSKICEKAEAAPIVIQPVMTGKQTNGYSCMDYVVQAAVTIKSRKNNEESELEDTLQDIVKADNAQSLRAAIIEHIASQHPEVRKQINKQSFMTETLHKSASGELKPKTNKWEEFAALVFSKAETDEASIEAKVAYTVVLSAEGSVEKDKHEVDVTETSQIELDEEYAKRLHEELNTEFDDEKFARELQAQFDEEERQNRVSYRG